MHVRARIPRQLLDLQHARVAALDQQFQDALRQLQDEFERERGSVAAAAARQRKEATDVAAAMAAGFNEAEAEARQEYEAARWAAGPAAVVLHQCMLCSTFCL